MGDRMRSLCERLVEKAPGLGDVGSTGACWTAGMLMKLRTGFHSRVIGGPVEDPHSIDGIPEARPGWADLGNPIDDDLISSLAQGFESRIMEDRFREDMDIPLPADHLDDTVLRWMISDHRVDDQQIDMFSEFPELVEIADKIQERVEAFYGCPVRLLWAAGRRTYHVPEKVVEETETYSNYWHLDTEPIDLMKVFIALSDIDEASGPTHYLDIDQTQRVQREREAHFRRDVEGIPGRYVEEVTDPYKFVGKRGQAMILNTTILLHRAGIPEPGEYRDWIQLQFSPASSPCSRDWREQSLWGREKRWGNIQERLRW